MFKAIAFFSSVEGSWHIVIGQYETEKAAYHKILEYSKEHESDTNLKYFEIR